MEFESFLSPMPRVVAHRGDSAFFPENTAEAFSSAASLGIDVIETDVHLTKDGEIVIWHDPTLERNTDGKGTLERKPGIGAIAVCLQLKLSCPVHIYGTAGDKRYDSFGKEKTHVSFLTQIE